MEYKNCPYCGYDFKERYKKDQIKISDGKDILPLVHEIRHKCQEHVIVITLDASYNVIEKRIIFIGTLNESLIHPREIFVEAITDRAAGIIMVHNHPTEDVNPSSADVQITRRLVEAGEIIGIPLLDHIIVNKTGYFSFKTMGMM
jgi:DNA repair protein RadC